MYTRVAMRQTNQDTENALLNGGTLEFWVGARPVSTDPFNTTGCTKLGTCVLGSPAFGATNSSGVAALNTVTADNSPAASGTIGFALAKASGGTYIYNFSVGLSAADIIVANLTVVAGTGAITINSGSVTFGPGA